MNRAYLLIAAVLGVGCSSEDATIGSTSDAGAGEAAPAPDATTSDSSSDGNTGPQSVTFAYKPQWDGAKKVEVVGGFGQATDWSKTASLLTLTDDGTGNFKGSTTLPAGKYPYVFRITGDSASATPIVFERYAVDPSKPDFEACPAASPTFDKNNANPCSDVTVAQGAAAAPIHVKGSLTVDAAPAAGWLVVLERQEKMGHHFFANRVTAGTDGTFDLVASAGSYRLQVLHPTLLNKSDLARDPVALAALRRAISNPFPLVSADVTVTAPDLAFHSYAQFAPTVNGGTLPTNFAFETGTAAKLDVYGSPSDAGVVDIGDPWYAGQATTDGGHHFDGVFNTPKAQEDAAAPGTRYMWGTEEAFDASVLWTKQTMVFPITWQ